MMSKNEEQTRKEIIDQRLLRAGWDVNAPSGWYRNLIYP